MVGPAEGSTVVDEQMLSSERASQGVEASGSMFAPLPANYISSKCEGDGLFSDVVMENEVSDNMVENLREEGALDNTVWNF